MYRQKPQELNSCVTRSAYYAYFDHLKPPRNPLICLKLRLKSYTKTLYLYATLEMMLKEHRLACLLTITELGYARSFNLFKGLP